MALLPLCVRHVRHHPTPHMCVPRRPRTTRPLDRSCSRLTCVAPRSAAVHVSHIVEETSALPFKPGVDWGAHQLHTTANVHTWCEMGTLDLQIEHHLFPNLAYESQEKVRHIVAATAKEFGLPYFHHRSLLHAYGAHIDWMGKLGNGFMEATSTSTSTSAPTKKEQ